MIETARLRLRAWAEADAAPLAAMCRSPEVTRYLGAPQTEPEIAATLARVAGRFATLGYGRWSVERREGGSFLGLCGLVPFDRPGTPIHGEIEIGWQLAPEHWGHGYASEAAAASLDWGWANLPCAQIVAITVPANVASQRVMARIGMVRRRDLDFGHPLFAAEHPLHRHIAYSIARPG